MKPKKLLRFGWFGVLLMAVGTGCDDESSGGSGATGGTDAGGASGTGGSGATGGTDAGGASGTGGSSATGGTDAGGASGTGGAGGAVGGGGQGGGATLNLTGTFTSWPSFGPMVGADVCWRDVHGDLCTTTDTDGRMTLTDVSAGADGAVTIDGAGVIPTVLPMVLGDQDLAVEFGLDSEGFIDGLYEDASLAADPGLGMVAIQTSDAGGTTISLSPSAGWEGPYYLDSVASGFDLTATESSQMGLAYFMQVDPAAGPFTVEAARNGVPCQKAEYGTALPSLEVFAGKQTHVRVHCN